MSGKELDNFVYKFHQLRRAGMTAHLDMDTHAGQAWVGLRVMLGPVKVQQQHQRCPPAAKNRSPSYYRRQERRKAAREMEKAKVNAEEAIAKAKDVSEDAIQAAVEATEKVTNDEQETAEDSEAQATSYKCELCDFQSNRESGLRIHMGRKHKTIVQLDGLNDDLDDSDEEIEHDIELYLKTGNFHGIKGPLQAVWMDVVSIVSENICEEEKGNEILNLLDAKRMIIEERNGPGSYKDFHPWKCINNYLLNCGCHF